jgi:hypothetical protein
MSVDLCVQRRRTSAIFQLISRQAGRIPTAPTIRSVSASAAFLIFALLASAHTVSAQWSSAGGNTTTTDKVGIGTTGPVARVDITTTADTLANIKSNISANGLNFNSVYNNSNYAPGITWTPTNLSTVHPAAGIWAFMSGGGSFLHLGTSNTYGGITNSALVIDPTGKVGIGTSTPAYGLDVNGNTNISGNITASGSIAAKYQDVAEWVPSSAHFAAGTVVVLDSSKSNHITSSSVAYDTRVAGVISAQPGIALGEKSDDKALVATTGRVKVKVDANKGAIHIGDLLVTSDVPGVAMKSEPVSLGGVQIHRPGTLIGKALEPLEKGSGEILVLLSLQ